MTFILTRNVHVRRDKSGFVRHLRHVQEPYTAEKAGLVAPTPQSLAAAYVRDVASIYSIDPSVLETLEEKVGHEVKDEGNRLRLMEVKTIGNITAVSYAQTHLAIPVWEAGFSLRIEGKPMRITSSQSSFHYDVKVRKPKGDEKFLPDSPSIRQFLDEIARKAKGRLTKLTSTQLMIYRYDPATRFNPAPERSVKGIEGPVPTLPLPKVLDAIRSGYHYVVTEVLFSLKLPPWKELNWRAFLEVETGAVLYLRAFVVSAFGNIFRVDPLTMTGNAAVTPCSSGTTLDPLTDVVTLEGLTPPATSGDPQNLAGEYVKLGEHAAPTVASPTATLPTGNFSFSAVTDDFAAVNAYYQCDRIFRMLREMGFTIGNYFPDTSFPVTVDHRDASYGTVNACGYGNSASNGSDGFGFNLCQSGCPVGIAADARVVLHEFCHACLWEHANSPTFGFAHSAGDSLAAILNDPDSYTHVSGTPDRGLTFPWITLLVDRRHDRDVAAGWGWGGTNDGGGYDSEQILSTTLFHVYRSIGGDSTHIEYRRFAAGYMAYLIFQAIGSISPITNPADPDDFATALMDADIGTVDFRGIPGGAIHKVIRWAFEKQGLYQPPGAPTPVTSAGAPPDVDVYIDDGRNGEYEYIGNFWSTTDIWNRLAPDGGTAHETPVVNTTNYLYVRVKNRGTQPANNVVVRAYHCIPATGLTWPDDWMAMTTTELQASGSIPSGGETVVGPFAWTPVVIGHECVLASVSADGDISNTETVTGSIPHHLLVPFDNNIGQRNLAPVPGGGGSLHLAIAFERRTFWAKNPYGRMVQVKIESLLPEFLRKRKWEISFLNPGGSSFKLGPKASRKIVLKLKQGGEFSQTDVEAAGKKALIEFRTLLDGIPAGGMTYAIDPEMKIPPKETLPTRVAEKEGYQGKISQVLYDCFGDFEGFVLNLCQGERVFKSREKATEEIVRRACSERMTVTVYTNPDDISKPLKIALHCK